MKDNNRIEYIYDAAGVKKRQIENHNGKIAKTTDFVGNFVYDRNKPAWHTFDEGRVIYEPDSTYFAETYIKDHLGNIRVVYGNDGVKDGIRQVNAYYPFGMNIQELSANSSSIVHRNEYLYNGKMMQDELGLDWLDYGFRFYDSKLARWHSIDPAIEYGHFEYTPYAYVYNNPVRFIDPFGLDSTQRANAVAKSEEYVDKNPGNSYLSGGKGQPGTGVDCSGMVSNCIVAGEEEDPVGKPGATGNGVKQIANGTKEVKNAEDVQVGNLIVLDNSSSGSDKPYGHIGIIIEIIVDNDGNVIGYKFNDSGGKPSSGKSGPRHSTAMIGSNYWGKRITGIYKFDSKPDRATSKSNSTAPGQATLNQWNPSISQRLHQSRVPILKTLGDIIDAMGL